MKANPPPPRPAPRTPERILPVAGVPAADLRRSPRIPVRTSAGGPRPARHPQKDTARKSRARAMRDRHRRDARRFPPVFILTPAAGARLTGHFRRRTAPRRYSEAKARLFRRPPISPLPRHVGDQPGRDGTVRPPTTRDEYHSFLACARTGSPPSNTPEKSLLRGRIKPFLPVDPSRANEAYTRHCYRGGARAGHLGVTSIDSDWDRDTILMSDLIVAYSGIFCKPSCHF